MSTPQFKHVRCHRDIPTGKWKLEDITTPLSTYEDPYRPYASYPFIVQHKIERPFGVERETHLVTQTVIIFNKDLQDVLHEIMKDLPNVSWSLRRLDLDPFLLLAYLPEFQHYLDTNVQDPARMKKPGLEYLSLLVKDYLRREYFSTLSKAMELKERKEVEFDFLWSILLPNTTIFFSCPVTSQPRTCRLRTAEKKTVPEDNKLVTYWILNCEYVEACGVGRPGFGFASIELKINEFQGVMKIAELPAYPLEYHPDEDNLKVKLIERGRKWKLYWDSHHVEYDGLTHRKRDTIYEKTRITERVMIDRRLFAIADPNYYLPQVLTELDSKDLEDSGDLCNNQCLLASPIVYGFCLVHKIWAEFEIDHVKKISWSREPFKNLEHRHKGLLRNLVKSYVDDNESEDIRFDDFVKGKGQGLVINLAGPPGVGKTLTVEAISEEVEKPLYSIGSSELGLELVGLENNLRMALKISSMWRAIVLIDEADIFMGERRPSDLQRNSLVTVFLRLLEYHPGILFLTTNRVEEFDAAILSRIHLSLSYDPLNSDAKRKLWMAFAKRAQLKLQSDQLDVLSRKPMSGREIKNTMKIMASIPGPSYQVLIDLIELTGRSVERKLISYRYPLIQGRWFILVVAFVCLMVLVH